MTQRPPKDVAASVRQRLLNKAHADHRPFNELLQYYVMERFLFRLGVSEHAAKFILKGALLFTAWRAPAARPTADIDLLARTSNAVDAIVTMVAEVIACIRDFLQPVAKALAAREPFDEVWTPSGPWS